MKRIKLTPESELTPKCNNCIVWRIDGCCPAIHPAYDSCDCNPDKKVEINIPTQEEMDAKYIKKLAIKMKTHNVAIKDRQKTIKVINDLLKDQREHYEIND